MDRKFLSIVLLYLLQGLPSVWLQAKSSRTARRCLRHLPAAASLVERLVDQALYGSAPGGTGRPGPVAAPASVS